MLSGQIGCLFGQGGTSNDVSALALYGYVLTAADYGRVEY